ncbi:helix-turn-helix transcriptional regulator [Brevibacterium casei]|uniref:helix-turn-helix transcriptional regulator n=1 Tax=Brevibacterium casei TaxID=33889 RepID=UPI0028A86FB4|nr:helix-turn-helix domain-containing protein [Brevibacterium casei]
MSKEVAQAAAEKIFSRQELAERYGVPVQTISIWKQKGYGPRSFRAGKYTRYRLSDILAWEESQVEAGA